MRLASLLLALTLALGIGAVAQTGGTDANGVELSWTYNYNHTGLNFNMINHRDFPVCITEDVDNQSYNVTGEVTPQFTLAANDSRFVGSVNQYESTKAWYGHVSYSWRQGSCN